MFTFWKSLANLAGLLALALLLWWAIQTVLG